MLVAGVHFIADDEPSAIARKALRVNLSDLAAMGADAERYLLALALAEDWHEDWLDAFVAGLAEDQRSYGVSLIGGDMVHTTGPLTVSITALGSVPEGTAVSRSGAKPGDRVYVSGTIGDAALGLLLRTNLEQASAWDLDEAAADFLVDRYTLPQPRGALAAALRGHASAAMDISDGLVGDFQKICGASGVGARIEADRIPLSSAALRVVDRDPAMRATLFTGGDDYEIVCAVPAAAAAGFESAAASIGLAVTDIGEVTAAGPLLMIDETGRTLDFGRQSYSHF
ncbi:MAG: thiamine-phosphate kinase, partial [Hyphomicrobiales bacterium]|nr:thiamine-phosphate kinase [Hyphomicrobiales bacterium]